MRPNLKSALTETKKFVPCLVQLDMAQEVTLFSRSPSRKTCSALLLLKPHHSFVFDH